MDWLSANLAGEIADGSEETIAAFFRDNPKAYSICLVLGIAFGLYSNQASLVALNGMEYFYKLRKEVIHPGYAVTTKRKIFRRDGCSE